jgi:hypothetical protein
LKSFVNVVRVNHDEHPEWASETKIKYIPGIMAVIDGSSYVYDDTQHRDARSILAWTRSLIPDVTRHVSTLDERLAFDHENFDRTLFYLLSNEPRPSFFYKALAYRMRNDVSMAFISSQKSKQFAALVWTSIARAIGLLRPVCCISFRLARCPFRKHRRSSFVASMWIANLFSPL